MNPKFVNLIDVLANKTDIEIVIEATRKLGIWISGVNPIFPESEPTDVLVQFRGASHAFSRKVSQEAEHLISILELYRDEVIGDFNPDDEHVKFVKTHLTNTTYGWQINNFSDELKQIETEIHPPLISINNLLFGYHRKKGLTHADIAWEIERSGIYMYGKFPNYTKISADSFHCASALTGLSAYYVSYNDERGMYEPYDSDPEADPTYLFGWPESEFPRFREPNEETQIEYFDSFNRIQTRVKAAFFKEDLYTLGRILLLTKATPAMVASAMEKYGLYGYDNFGRVQYHDQTSVKQGVAYLKVHRPLSDYAASIIKKGIINFETLENEAFSIFGWPKEKLPDFNEFKNNQPIINAPQVVNDVPIPTVETTSSDHIESVEDPLTGNERANYQKLIAGLLFLIQGHLDGKKHPSYPRSEAEFIRMLLDKLKEVPGANLRFFKDTFRDVKALRHHILTLQQIKQIDSAEAANTQTDADNKDT